MANIATTHDAFRAQTASRLLAYRLAVPIAALCLFAALVLLWCTGAHSLYFNVLRLVGVEPFGFPFLDTHAVLAAAECGRQGVDIYQFNPCDALGRPHVYSPFWLVITPGFLGVQATSCVGLSLDILFILSLPVVLRPRTLGDIFLLGLAALSPMTVYALERANNDVVVYLLIVCASALLVASRPYRLCSYALFLSAGLLKYYPIVLLLLLAREPRRHAILAASIVGLILISFGVYYHFDLDKALANVPSASYFTDAFSAENLPFGFAGALGNGLVRPVIAIFLLSALSMVTIARARRMLRLLDRENLDWERWELQCLAIGSMLVTVCFFAGQNVNYRGVYFLLALPGLIHLYRLADKTSIRHLWGQTIAAVLFVMWDEFFRRAIHAMLVPFASDGMRLRVEIFFWVGRELIWWWVIAGLSAIVLSYLRRTSSVRGSRAGPARSIARPLS
ncbi:MAG: hypothetical protein JO282_03130 [Alphaproteobacteria bacterium]|nr:hypothetical protein [Alphaproteobacteria bacterium]